MNTKRIAIFASGTGSNALNIIEFFKDSASVEIAFVLSNKSDAKIVAAAKEKGVMVHVVTNEQAADGQFLSDLCAVSNVQWIVLAGYLRKIPGSLIQAFPNKIINIHPSLLPLYGGKGMYGNFVHEAVIANREVESGITIHFVNEEFDKGEIIAQFKCMIDDTDSVVDLQRKIHKLEQINFPTVIEKTIK